MNTVQLTSLARSCPTTMRCFRGVYAIDTLSHNQTTCSTYICNLDTHDKPGSHWIALYVPSKASKPIEYFDSYGFEARLDLKTFSLI
jgi:hypothetical protein